MLLLIFGAFPNFFHGQMASSPRTARRGADGDRTAAGLAGILIGLMSCRISESCCRLLLSGRQARTAAQR
jgi:hypothetical protein